MSDTRRLIGLLAVAGIAACAPGADGPGPGSGREQPREVVSATGDLASVVAGNSAFAWDLYRQLAVEDDNVVLSPFSVSAALGMTSAGTRGDTEAQLGAALHQDIPADRWHPAWGQLIGDLAGDKGRPYRLEVANRLFGQSGYPFLEDFLAICEDDWGAPLEEVDWMGSPEVGRQIVNDWVEEQTSGLIEDLLPEKAVGSDTRLVLANAVYFLANWETQFDEDDTRPAPFHTLDGGEVQVDMMFMDTTMVDEPHHITARWTDEGQTGIARLPYKGDEVAAYLIVPSEVDGLPEWEQRITSEAFDEEVAPLRMDRPAGTGAWIIQMPKLELEWKQSLIPALRALGVEDLFEDGVCDLTGMVLSPEADTLFVSEVLHSTYLKVDEVGTEAAAATAVVVTEESGAMINEIKADRPFLFVVRDDLTGSILFMARVMDPTAG